YVPATHHDLPSFPPRRSSDLDNRVRFLGLPGSPLLESANTTGFAEVHPDEKGPADNVLLGHKAPIAAVEAVVAVVAHHEEMALGDRKSTRLNSSHVKISYAVF